jgi:hypothetical protein
VDTVASGAPIEAKRTTDTAEYAGTGPVDISCFEKASWPAAAASQSVKVKGYARNFASGCDVVGATIEIYKVKRGGADDGALGDLIGSTVTIPNVDCTAELCKTVEAEKCSSGRTLRAFEYPNVPTETELIIKTGVEANGYLTLYDYGIYIAASDVTNGEWTHDVRVVAQGDYTLIPTTATGHPLSPGNGAIAGEIHDCGDVRISGASVDVSTDRSMFYFTDNEEYPLPDPAKHSTSSLGLYAALDVPEGPARVAAMAVVGGKLVSLGYYDVRVYADSISALTFRGFKAHQAAVAGK